MHIVSCTNTHHDATDLLNHGTVKNTKTRITWEWNITFLRNKKILNLCLRWHILRSYCFVAEVTFKETKGWKNVCKIRAAIRTQSSIYDELFCTNSLRLEFFSIFAKNFIMFGWVLNTPLKRLKLSRWS